MHTTPAPGHPGPVCCYIFNYARSFYPNLYALMNHGGYHEIRLSRNDRAENRGVFR